MRARARIALLLLLAAAHARAATPVAEVVNVVGRGEHREAQQSSWQPARPKQALFPTEFVRTLDLSKMAILFADRTRLQLSQNSTLQIKGAGAGPDAKTILNLNAGRAWATSKAAPRGVTMETPSATAAIRGTEWEMAVDEEGRATLSVFSGEVELFNDQGTVLVGANEQARAERGKAPVKLTLRVSRERVQWVSSFTIDTRRYGDPSLPQIEALVREQRLSEAYERLKRLVEGDAGPAAYLLLADFEVYRGELAAADQVLARASARFPADERFDIAIARISLLSDRPALALARARAALAKRPDSVEALLAVGDIERHEGHAREALAAYARAAELAAKDARAWHGIGVVESEREDVRRGRSHLEQAIALDATEAAYPAELGTLEGFAGNFARARGQLQKALSIHPDNYVALTGLGVVELKAGHLEAALDALSRAALIEPRYARAHLYLAAAYYRMERDAAALEELARAAEADPNDPLPHLLASIVHLDRIEPGRAAQAAREALARMPFLKSLNQVASNQKGIANAGYPLAFMGLEAWARSAAHESYLPFWGASHLFLADRYPGDFNRRSELMQGFITDPLVFGASNRFQSLFLEPGHHATLSLRGDTSHDGRGIEPVVTLNGYQAAVTPFAYFVEAADTHHDPRGLDFGARVRTFTAALGVKPTYDLGAFVYLNHLSADIDIGRRDALGDFANVSGNASRVDAGVRYAPDARSNLWVKAGASREDSTEDEVFNLVRIRKSLYTARPETSDVAARYTRVLSDTLEASTGAEAARLRNPIVFTRDAAFHLPDAPPNQQRLDQTDRDRSESVFASARATLGVLRLEAGVAWRDYRKDSDYRVTLDALPGAEFVEAEHFRRRKVDPMLGATWRLSQGALVRGACRRWLRPIAPDTMMPVAVAGMALDDQLVFAGGQIEQCRAQADWMLSSRSFVSAAAERIETANLVSLVALAVLNTRTELTNLDRLRNRVLTPVPKPDQLEDTPVYAGGVIRRASIAFEQIVTQRLGARVHYTYTDSENNDPPFAGLRVPYLARHQTDIGLTWTPGWHTRVTAQAVHRTRRYADESNVAPLRAGWDGYVSIFAETPDKRWAIEVQGANLLKRETVEVFSIILSYRL